jgi:hypothetical protein
MIVIDAKAAQEALFNNGRHIPRQLESDNSDLIIIYKSRKQ